MKTLKKALALTLAASMTLALAACGGGGTGGSTATPPPAGNTGAPVTSGAPAGGDEKIGGTLTIYTTTDDSNIERVIPAYEEKTGVEVEIISGSAGECIARIQAEKENPQCDVMWGGLTPSDLAKYEPVCVELLQSGADNVEIVYMEEGTTAGPFGAAIVKDAQNLDQAKAFIEYLTSEECQTGYAQNSSSRPANANLPSTNPYIVDYSTITVLPEDQEYLAAHKSEIQQKWTDLWAKYN